MFIAGAITMTVSSSFPVMLLGRIVTGLGVGCGFVVSPVYITEITPPAIRGRLVSLTDVCINVGILLGYIVSFGGQLSLMSCL